MNINGINVPEQTIRLVVAAEIMQGLATQTPQRLTDKQAKAAADKAYKLADALLSRAGV